MSLEPLFVWLGQTPPGVFLAKSTASFAATETLHLISLAVLAGTVLIIDLTALRAIFKQASPAEVERSLRPVLLGALAVIAVSGVLLVAAGPLKYYTNAIFPVKLATLLVAVLVQAGVHVALEKRREGLAKGLAVASLVLWLSVIILGRWLGLI
ncbi:MAG: hypothetical protein J7521_19045 [Caulobacter sp.]|nr:hypothetical protein [Caulobacter sp.]